MDASRLATYRSVMSSTDAGPAISAEFPYESKYVEVLGSRMHYVEQGEGDPILFVHGNPTSSYLWRNVIPHVSGQGRAIALDLIGMGRSDKPDLDYRFFDHAEYFDGFVRSLGLGPLILVLHDWGGGIGLRYARLNSDNVRAVAFMEAVVKPPTWAVANPVQKVLFKRMRNPRTGDKMNLEKNFFVERLIPMMVKRKLTEQERAAYRVPYPDPASRKPVAQWPREIPFEGEGPADVYAEIADNWDWLRHTDIPKLFLHAKPGAIFNKAGVKEIELPLSNLTSVGVGKGLHYIQEDQPHEIGRQLSAWIRSLPAPG